MPKCIDCKYYSSDSNTGTACSLNASWPHGAYCTEFEQATVQQEEKDTVYNSVNAVYNSAITAFASFLLCCIETDGWTLKDVVEELTDIRDSFLLRNLKRPKKAKSSLILLSRIWKSG